MEKWDKESHLEVPGAEEKQQKEYKAKEIKLK